MAVCMYVCIFRTLEQQVWNLRNCILVYYVMLYFDSMGSKMKGVCYSVFSVASLMGETGLYWTKGKWKWRSSLEDCVWWSVREKVGLCIHSTMKSKRKGRVVCLYIDISCALLGSTEMFSFQLFNTTGFVWEIIYSRKYFC